MKELRIDAAKDAKSLVGTRLLTEGLVQNGERAWLMFRLPIAVALVVPVWGLVRIRTGVLHGQPVALLVLLSMFWGVLLYVFFRETLFTRPHLTTYGAERLNALEIRHQDFVRESPLKEISLATALLGVGVLLGGPFMDLGIALDCR